MNISEEQERILSQLTSESKDYSVRELVEQFVALNALEAFQNTPTYLPSPVEKAKEIALDAAVKLIGSGSNIPGAGVLLAEEIYQWLIEKENNG